MSENISLIDVCYAQIKDNFYYGFFGDFKIVIDRDTGCFNATKLCNDSNKKYRNWARSKKARKLFDYYNCKPYEVRLQNNDPLHKQIAGQYLPGKFLDHVIYWMTPIPVKEGFVYVVTTSHLKSNNIYNIGYTKNVQNIPDVFNCYLHSSEPKYYIVALYSTSDAKRLESTIHRKLRVYRDEGEYFKCHMDTIKAAFESEECMLEPYPYDKLE